MADVDMFVSQAQETRIMDKLIKKPSCKQIIDIIPDPFVVIDRDYKIVAANRHYLRHYGYNDADEVVGQHCYKISHRVDAPCSEHGEHCPLETVFRTRQSTQVMHIHYDQYGAEEHVQLHSTPLFDDDGKVLYVGEYIYPLSKESEEPLLIGRSRPMLRLASLLQRVAQTSTSVLLQGESGVGKERVAEYLHQYSGRANFPFVIVDCGTLGENLIESELFGHERGSFTGANKQKIGLFEAAEGGSLFIDEIGELPLSLQTKLLRVLESGTIRRLGGTQYIRVNVRVIAATNRELLAMVDQGSFRQDLYYRLSAFPVHVPALRERLDDIALLAEHFLGKFEEGDRFTPLSPEVVETLMDYDYPGNVRELRNIVERAAILARGEELLRPEHIVFDQPGRQPLPEGRSFTLRPPQPCQHGHVHGHAVSASTAPTPSATPASASRDRLLSRRDGRLDHESVLHALQQSDGHRADAAKLLGVSERTLYRYVQRMREQA
ncbi:MAG: sigma-54 interaction domain-containing protein [Thiohalomonadaceae bacterium]